MTGDGKRQILAFYVPGDIPDLHSLHLKVLDMSVVTITPCKVGFIPHEILRDVCNRYPRIAAALWRDTLIDGAIFREWMINVGRRPAISRLGHLMCEMVVRLRAVGLAEDNRCDLPITQSELSDAVGLSAVHVNRTLQELRGSGLIEWRGGHAHRAGLGEAEGGGRIRSHLPAPGWGSGGMSRTARHQAH